MLKFIRDNGVLRPVTFWWKGSCETIQEQRRIKEGNLALIGRLEDTTSGRCIEFPAPWIGWIEEYATNGRIIAGGG